MKLKEALTAVIHGDMKETEGFPLTGKVGFVYPDEGESYYIHSNIGSCIDIDCEDGYFFAGVENED